MNRHERRRAEAESRKALGLVVGHKGGMSRSAAMFSKLDQAVEAVKQLKVLEALSPSIEAVQTQIAQVHAIVTTLIDDYQALADEQSVHGQLLRTLFEMKGVDPDTYESILKECREAVEKDKLKEPE
jgi:hypothetical protein